MPSVMSINIYSYSGMKRKGAHGDEVRVLRHNSASERTEKHDEAPHPRPNDGILSVRLEITVCMQSSAMV